LKLSKAAEVVSEGTEETTEYYKFPPQHWRWIRTNNPMERINMEIRRWIRVVGSFPDGKLALMLAAALLRHIASTKWGTRLT
jgi:transposase-like protein